MIVWVSGPTGSGKSSFTKLLSGLGYSIVKEVFDKEIFGAFLTDPASHCAPLQEAILRSRFEQWKVLKQACRVAFDRSMDEDIKVFCQMHHDAGLLGGTEFGRLQALGNSIMTSLPSPDLIILMAPNRQALAERVTPATHPPPIVEGLDRQIDLYEEWIGTRSEPILRIDNSACSPEDLSQLFSGSATC